MTKRAIIITSSVLVAIMMIVTILFGVVFRVKNIQVVHDDNFHYSVSYDEIVSASKLKTNSSIFKVNRNKVMENIENAYPYARVSVNLSSLTSVKISLSNREPLYYFAQEGTYYILDEDCKILDCSTDSNLTQNLVKLDNVFSVSEGVNVGTFLINGYTSVCNDLYKAMYTNATIEAFDNETSEYVEQYLNRKDIGKVVQSIKFSQVDELSGRMDKLHISTIEGVEITIIEPQRDLNIKINRAFSIYRALQEKDRLESSSMLKSGSINVGYQYDVNGNASLICDYRA